MSKRFCMMKKMIPVFAAALMLPAFSAAIGFSMECVNSDLDTSVNPPGVDQPSDLAIGLSGDIYLVDGVNDRVVVTTGSGAPRFNFGKRGNNPGEFKNPLGIDISTDGRVFIADTGNHRIQVFNQKGVFLYLFPVKTSPGEKPADPVDVLAIDLKNYLYISDNDNHKIKVHKQDGAFEFEWGGFGEVRGMFRYPGILAVNEYNQIFVVDVLNTRIQKFDPYGNFIAEIGTWGVIPGGLFKPKGVAVDRAGRVFVTDSFMGCIQVFTDLGGFVGVVCENGSKREFTTPVGVAFDAANRLHVVEMRANRLRILNVPE